MRQLKRELWPFKIKLDLDDTHIKMDEIELWLGEQLGPFKSDWNAVYNCSYTDFYFKSNEDAVMFRLMWA